MADLRKLVARAIAEADIPEPGHFEHCPGWPDCEHQHLIEADAVLAALTEAGVLLPELPEGWRVQFVEWGRYVGYEHTYVARLSRIDDDDEYFQGFGSTFPAAMADALKGGDDAPKD